MKLSVNDPAPPFNAQDQFKNIHTLNQYKGKWVFLYFYPKDHTSGCTKEACAFRDHYQDLKSHVSILGVSKDSVESHQGFAEKFALPFPLLADTETKIIKSYGADGIIFPKRISFLIDPQGIIQKIYPKIDPQTHVLDVLTDIKTLR